MWYKNCYRRHLMDMHINDWDADFLSKFSIEEYVENLKKAKIQNAMIYFQSHVGLCNWPTKTGKMHSAFVGKEDMIKRLVDLCHQNGIKVVGYYSINYNNYAHNEHPEWRAVDYNGKSIYEKYSDVTDTSLYPQPYGTYFHDSTEVRGFRYGLCCSNNVGYREFVKAQIKEMVEFFDVEGLFFDMPFWTSACYCESCRERWRNEIGTELVNFGGAPEGNDTIALFHRKQLEWMGEFTQMITDYVKSLNPSITVEHNISAAASAKLNGTGEAVNNSSEFAGGDINENAFTNSCTCKLYHNLTKNRPFEYMFARGENLRKHTAIRSVDEIMSYASIITAHHGATLLIDAINLDGSMNELVYKRLGDVFEKTACYDKYMQYGEMVEDIGIYYTLKGKGCAPDRININHHGVMNTVANLIKNNICCGITGAYHRDIGKYKTIIAPMLTCEDEVDNHILIDHVKNGGRLYISGGFNPQLVEEFFGARVEGFTESDRIYISPCEEDFNSFEYFTADSPLFYDGKSPVVTGMDTKCVKATLTLPRTNPYRHEFASIHSNPPYYKTDIPALAVTEYGKGKVVWCAVGIECVKHYDQQNIVRNIVTNYLRPEFTVRTTAPANVETVCFADDDAMLISNVLLNNDDIAPATPSFEVTVYSDKEPKSVELLPQGERIGFTCTDGKIIFATKEMHIFDMYKITY